MSKPVEFTLSNKPETDEPTPEALLATVVDVFGRYVEAVQATNPDLDSMLDHIKAMQSLKNDVVEAALKAMRKPSKEAIKATGEDRYENPRGVKATIYTSNRVTWDRPALESLLGDEVDDFRKSSKVETFKVK